ncbi:MAG: hypothetical protein U0796_03965 [Gemmatales bacterium]
MPIAKRRYSKTDFAARGDAFYEQKVVPCLQPADQGKFVAIDIETGEFEIDQDQMQACDRLYGRVPAAQVWMARVGSRYLHRFGGAARRIIS